MKKILTILVVLFVAGVAIAGVLYVTFPIQMTTYGGMSATLRDVTYLVRERGLLFRSFLSMFVVMPVAVAFVAHVSNLPEAVKIALVALAIAPVPPILPRRELKAGGHAAYAVGLLAMRVKEGGNLLSA